MPEGASQRQHQERRQGRTPTLTSVSLSWVALTPTWRRTPISGELQPLVSCRFCFRQRPSCRPQLLVPLPPASLQDMPQEHLVAAAAPVEAWGLPTSALHTIPEWQRHPALDLTPLTP
uniref:Uncharacterized protein n=1 Tax=Sphaerodactylus townsendi TaxID=933632 RepID=A0ACB8FTA2_9SAUR